MVITITIFAKIVISLREENIFSPRRESCIFAERKTKSRSHY